jgi:hypothetical protein
MGFYFFPVVGKESKYSIDNGKRIGRRPLGILPLESKGKVSYYYFSFAYV